MLGALKISCPKISVSLCLLHFVVQLLCGAELFSLILVIAKILQSFSFVCVVKRPINVGFSHCKDSANLCLLLFVIQLLCNISMVVRRRLLSAKILKTLIACVLLRCSYCVCKKKKKKKKSLFHWLLTIQ